MLRRRSLLTAEDGDYLEAAEDSLELIPGRRRRGKLHTQSPEKNTSITTVPNKAAVITE